MNHFHGDMTEPCTHSFSSEQTAKTVYSMGETYWKVIVLIVASANAVTNSHQDRHSDWPPDEEDRHTEQESFDETQH